MKKLLPTCAVIAIALLVPRVAQADVVWPALLLEGRILTWWAIGIGLLAEWPVVAWLLSSSWHRTLLVTVLANLASTVLGIVLIPIAGVAWEFFPGLVLFKVFNVGTFNPGTWAATVVGAAAINGFIELLVVRRFGPIGRRRPFLFLWAINAVSVGLATASLFAYPPQT